MRDNKQKIKISENEVEIIGESDLSECIKELKESGITINSTNIDILTGKGLKPIPKENGKKFWVFGSASSHDVAEFK